MDYMGQHGASYQAGRASVEESEAALLLVLWP
jgi:hypothetical protein